MLQVEPVWKNTAPNLIRYGKVGSMPTRDAIPFLAVEDNINEIVWAVSLTHGSSWEMRLYNQGNKISISGGLADREFGHWTKKIRPGETLSTPKAVLTVVEGCVNLAAQRLVENMRKSIRIPAMELKMPIIFNELYTTKGKLTEEKLLSMIRILQDKGILYYVIGLAEQYHFPQGMKWLAMEIQKGGMIPGIELEFEIINFESVTFDWEYWLLMRDEVPITSGISRFWDFRLEDVQEYFKEKVIDFIRNSGFGYIKISYKENIGIGCDDSDSLGEGLFEQIEAVQRFWDKIVKEIPNIVIENGAYGGSRMVASFLERSNLVSFSEATERMEMPIVAANMQRVILPRQSLIWVVVRKEHPDSYYYYQFASAMLGRMCISGDIETLDEMQWKIIRKGIQFYNKVTDIIDKGVTSYYDAKTIQYSNLIGWQGILRASANGERLLVVIHTFQDCPSKVIIPLQEEVLIKSNAEVLDQWCLERVDVRLKGGTIEITGHSCFDGIAVMIGINK
jgi:alpha-galactosidase